MNVTKNKRGHRTVTFAPYGRVPLHDAKESITLTLSEQACREGKTERAIPRTALPCKQSLTLPTTPPLESPGI